MTDPTRGVRQRRSTRRPAWPLLTALLVLAIVASSALVFTDKVELLKLAVIIALWAAVVAAFISFIYRRQSDVDQAKVRDLKLVYDLQLDREISARREYELSVESNLRRELASEIRAQGADEVAALRAELAALRANLQVLFDTDLQDRPALETERAAVPSYGRVISSRVDAERLREPESDTDESPIIDVPEEPQPADYGWTPPPPAGGAHRRASQRGQGDNGWRPAEPPPVPTPPSTRSVGLPWLAPEPAPEPKPVPPPPASWPVPPAAPEAAPAAMEWQPPAESIATPPGPVPPPPVATPDPVAPPASPDPVAPRAPVAPPATPDPVAPRAPVAPPATPDPVAPPATPAMAPSHAEPRRARHGTSEAAPAEERARARHSAADAPDPGRPNPTLATPPHAPPTQPPPEPGPSVPPFAPPRRSRHREAGDTGEADAVAGQHEGGQSLAELLARLQTGTTSQGGGRRRRDD